VTTERPTLGSQSSLREANRGRILDAIKRFGALTQVEIADAAGLSTATVSNIVKELTANGVVTTSPVSRSGRRALQVSLARRLGLVAGVHFASRTLRIELSDLVGTVIAQQHMPLPADHRADTGMDRAALLIADLLESIGASHEELRGVGLGIAAPVDHRDGSLPVHGIQRGWDEVQIAPSMARRLDTPVFVDNDANLAALAERRFGAAQGADVAAYVYVGHGVGAGLVIDGQIFRGAAGTAGEIGHIRVVDSGAICHCGNRGCLETVVNANALVESLRATHGNLSLRDVVNQCLAGDAGCSRVVADAGLFVGVAVAALANVINPRVVVIGGELARCGDLLLDPIRNEAGRAVLRNPASPLRIVQAALGDLAPVRGATALALDSVSLTADITEVSYAN
jgi:predicted NBD/HSP70 family sugar kinase